MYEYTSTYWAIVMSLLMINRRHQVRLIFLPVDFFWAWCDARFYSKMSRGIARAWVAITSSIVACIEKHNHSLCSPSGYRPEYVRMVRIPVFKRRWTTWVSQQPCGFLSLSFHLGLCCLNLKAFITIWEDSYIDEETIGERLWIAWYPWWRHRWISRTKASDAELWYFPWPAPEKTVG